ncbi:MAG: hypothetical protein CVV37_02175 [Nitrospira bacterium HGW-Nitrospira-1]|nr:MAG: hypothetical protein CVV37_02175 [Nitrospira bacterium HGW-Nitrospira-1]
MSKGRVLVIDDSLIMQKLAGVVLAEAGYEVFTAKDGEEGLKTAEDVLPSLILVDFIMPKINGYQFCKMINSNQLLKDIPIILITAKGKDVGEKFTEKFGIVDYFIKPFQPEDLLEKVNSALKAREAVEVVETAKIAAAGGEDTKPVLPAYSDTDIGEVVDKIIRGYFYNEFSFLIQKSMTDILKQAGVIKAGGIILSGDISDFSLFDIFQLIDTAKATGKLFIHAHTMSSEIYFEQGNIVYASTSRGEKAVLTGDLLEKRKNIPKEVFNQVVRKAKETGVPILRAFINEGVLTANDITAILKERIEAAIYSTMELEDGNFFFEKIPVPDNLSDISIRLNASQLILEGARRVGEKSFAAKMFEDDNIVFIRFMSDGAMEDITLEENELKIFSLIDGKRKLVDIVNMAGIEINEAKRIFHTLTRVGILKIKEA